MATVSDDIVALEILCELLARLSAVPAPAGVRRLSDFAADLLDRVPRALTLGRDPSEHRLIQACASALEEVHAEAGDRLLHEDLHYFNILAPLRADQPEPWLAIDPNPLAGDPGFVLPGTAQPVGASRRHRRRTAGHPPPLRPDDRHPRPRPATRNELDARPHPAKRSLGSRARRHHLAHQPDRAIAHTLLDSAG